MSDYKDRYSEKGLSLIELSLAMVVLSIIIVPMLQLYEMSQEKRRVTLNIEKIERVTHALNKFAQQNGRLPAPAALSVAPNLNNYGFEITGIAPPFACAAFTASKDVVCSVQSATYPNKGTSPAEVLIGIVPFQSLGLNEDDAYDMYGSRITYAVTRALTDAGTFNNSAGAIAIINQNDTVLDGGSQDPTFDTANRSNVLYAVISHGRDRKGAYSKAGGVVATCNSEPGLDQTNCQHNAWFRAMQAPDPKDATKNILSDQISLATGAEHFDDLVRYRTTTLEGMWTQQRNLSAAREDIVLSSPQKVFVGGSKQSAEEAKYMLDVKGNVRATGLTYSKSLCEQTDSTGRCFRVTNIANGDPNATGVDAPIYCGTKALNKIVKTGTDEKDQYAEKGCLEASAIKSQTMIDKATTCPNGYKGWEVGQNLSCK